MTFQRTTLVSLLALLAAGPALAECGIEGAGSVRILSNDFEALRVVNAAAQECATDAVTVTANATTEHKNIQVPALTANPAEYSVAMVANNSIGPLLGDDLIRPLDDLVAQYGQQLQPSQLIKIDGKTMAIAFMGNGQHLFYRKDILDQAGVAAPKSYEDILAAAEAIRTKGIMQYPLAASVKPGWDLDVLVLGGGVGLDGDRVARALLGGGIDDAQRFEVVGQDADRAGAFDAALGQRRSRREERQQGDEGRPLECHGKAFRCWDRPVNRLLQTFAKLTRA